ncbi:hypothetical protein DE146DRAFT_631716 [Phaeosphaeria sp. MPI-PUGE-AT-0046c]|nr:hypothetical protein DE146DRAFT_631716 [Phaeosphaeria sp. MPI-PUGE-AT-0046c]
MGILPVCLSHSAADSSQRMSSTERVEKRGSAATVRACDLCRKRKRRCLWNSGTQGCTPCVNLKETCLTTHVRKQRAKPQRAYDCCRILKTSQLMKARNRIAEYESRIHRLEALLVERNEAQPQIETQPLQPADSSVTAAEWVNNLRNELPLITFPDLPDFEALQNGEFGDNIDSIPRQIFGDDHTFVLEQGGHAHNGVDPDFTTQVDLEPSLEFREDAAFLQSTTFDLDSTPDCEEWPPPLPAGPIKCDCYLPPPELGTALLSEFLVDFNTAYPLFRPQVIVEHLRICYAGYTDGSAVSWVCAYIIFGLAYGLRAMSATPGKHDKSLAKYYLARTYNSLNSLLLSPPSLGLVQCLIGVALLAQSTPCGRSVPNAHFLSTSLRIAQTLAYHEDGIEITETDRDIEQERRVFWLGFISDTNTSMLSNAPTTQRREDIAAPKPDENPADSLGAVVAAEGHWKVNIFSLRVCLALLQAEAIEQVFSPKGRSLGPVHLEAATTVVHARLQAYHEHEIFQLRPDQLFQLLYRSDIAHTACLEASYFATIYRLYSFCALDRNPRINPFAPDGLRRMATVKAHHGYPAAKRLMSLLPIAPRGDVAWYWLHHLSLTAALVTVLAHHVNNPEEPAATKDELRCYHELIKDLGILVEKDNNPRNADIAQGRALCMDLMMRLETSLRLQLLQTSARCREEASAMQNKTAMETQRHM